MSARWIAAVGLPLLLAGCGQMKMPGTATSAAPPSSIPGATQTTPSADTRTKVENADLSKTGQIATVKVSTKAEQSLSTVEDLECKQLIAPFSLTDNATILSELGVSGVQELWDQFSSQWVQQFVAKQQTTAGRNQAVAKTRHQINENLRITALRMNWLPMEVEVAYGRAALEGKKKAGALDKSSDAPKRQARAQALLNDALKAVEAGRGPKDPPMDYKFEVYVTTDGDEGAAALPGGIILIDKELVSDDLPETKKKARFAIAHEVGHILRRHETRALQARIIDAVSMRGSVTDLARVMRGVHKEPTAVVALVVAGKLQFERHYAFQELAADSCGERIVRKMVNDNDTQTIDILRTFVASLPAVGTEPGATTASVGSKKGRTPAATNTATTATPGSRTTAIKDPVPDLTDPRNVPAAGAPGNVARTAAQADNALNTIEDLVVIVTRPIDQHPNTEERIKNFNRLLENRQLALKKAKEQTTRPQATTRPQGRETPRTIADR